MRWLWIYFALLVGGLATMLIDGFGLLAFLVYYAGMPLGAVAVWWLSGRSAGALVRGEAIRALRVAVPGAIGAALAAGAIYAALAVAGWAALDGPRAAFGRFLLVLSGQQVLVAGFEELAFRGVMQALLIDRLGMGRGLGIAAGSFGLFHLPNLIYQDVPGSLIPVALANLTVMGVVFGWAFERSGRLLALPVVLHFGWNMATYSFEDGFGLRFNGPALITGDPAWFPESGLATLLGLALVGALAWALTRKNEREAAFRQHRRLA